MEPSEQLRMHPESLWKVRSKVSASFADNRGFKTLQLHVLFGSSLRCSSRCLWCPDPIVCGAASSAFSLALGTLTQSPCLARKESFTHGPSFALKTNEDPASERRGLRKTRDPSAANAAAARGPTRGSQRFGGPVWSRFTSRRRASTLLSMAG